MIVETNIEAPEWEAAGLPSLAEAAAAAALTYLGLGTHGFAVSLLGCDDARIAALNTEFRGKAGATNVLSWPAEERTPDELPGPGDEDDPQDLGDIAISYETCAAEARAAGLDLGAHVTHLCVHAILHLLGYDHVDDRDAALMEGTERAILAGMGLHDPYV